MELDVLPRRDVAESARVRVAHVGECLELIARQYALRDFHAQHLRIVGLALPVRATHEAKRAPLIWRQLASLVLLERRHELIDVGHTGEREPRAPERFRIIYD